MKVDIHYLFTAKYAQWIVIALIGFFSLLIIGEFATLFLSASTELTVLNSTPITSSPQKTINYSAQVPLFGVYVPNNLDDGVKQSMLDLSVVGILLGNEPADSQVIIKSAGGDEKTYKIDDKIPGGAVIKRIMDGGIVVEHEGTLESLSLPKNELTFEPVAKPLVGE